MSVPERENEKRPQVVYSDLRGLPVRVYETRGRVSRKSWAHLEM